MSTPSEIRYFIWYNERRFCIRVVDRWFGRYYLVITKCSDDTRVIYNSANEATVMRVLRVYGALNDPVVSLMFPHWRVEE